MLKLTIHECIYIIYVHIQIHVYVVYVSHVCKYALINQILITYIIYNINSFGLQNMDLLVY